MTAFGGHSERQRPVDPGPAAGCIEKFRALVLRQAGITRELRYQFRAGHGLAGVAGDAVDMDHEDLVAQLDRKCGAAQAALREPGVFDELYFCFEVFQFRPVIAAAAIRY